MPDLQLAHERFALANGLQVILRRDARLPIVAVNLWYHVGPANEEPGRTGFAHLFEHLMFQGSGHVPADQHFALLEAAGASFVNGSTDFDRTNYLEDVPADQLELALWLESDRMGFLLDRLDERMLANQQDVVRNERRQSVENEPYGLVEEALWQALFPPGHPYRANVMGSHADIQAARYADVAAFFRRYYVPNNASLAIVGDVDPAEARRLVEKYFGTIPRGEPVPPVRAQTPPLAAEHRQVVGDSVELPRVYLAWLTAPIFTPGDAEADVAARLLGGGKASRLYRALVYERQIAQNVAAHQISLTLGSVFQIVATAKPGHPAAELEAAIDEELARLAGAGPSEEETAAARTLIRAQRILALESIGGFSGVANLLNLYLHHLGDSDRLAWDLDRYARVTPAGVRRFVREALHGRPRVALHGVPGEKVIPPEPPPAPEAAPETALEPTPAAAPGTGPEAGPPAAAPPDREPWRATPPPRASRRLPPLPAARRLSLSGGLPLFLVEARELPVVAAHLVVRAGSAEDPPDRPGLAGFTAAMLDEGAAGRDALAIARDLEAMGASLATGATEDGSYVSARGLKERAPELLRLLADVARRPDFPPAEIERLRHERRTALLQQRDDHFRTALRAMTAVLYGEAHPYGHTVLGSDDGLACTTRADLLGFYRAHWRPEGAALVLAGDLDPDEALALAEEAFGDWRGESDAGSATGPAAAAPAGAAAAGRAAGADATAAALAHAPARTSPARVAIVDRPETPQTAVLVGQVAVPRSHPDFEALHLLNEVLGGLFTSRVNLNLREDKGWTYGAFSLLPPRRGPGPLLVGARVQANASGPAVAEILKEIDGVLAAPLSAAELALARDSIVRSLPALFETTGATVATFGGLFLHEQPPDYFEGLPARLASLTAAGILEAARRHLEPARLRVALVGDRDRIAPQLEPLGLGEAVACDLDGNPRGDGPRPPD